MANNILASQNKNILYIHDSCPHPFRSGSDLVIYRHLKRAEENGWRIHVILPQSSFPHENRLALPSTWRVLPIKNPSNFIKPWMINRLRFFVYLYYLLFSFKFIREANSPIILSYFWGFNLAGFARYVAWFFNKKLIYFYHDRYEFFFPAKYEKRLSDFEYNNAKQADLILTVSDRLIFNTEFKSKHKVLLPMPAGRSFSAPANLSGKNWVYAGTLYPEHHIFFKSLAQRLLEFGGVITIVANLDESVLVDYKNYHNIRIHERFETNEEALNYINNNASIIITGYPENLSTMPWIADCFPSKFIEYCYFDIPVVAFSPQNTAFFNWCLHQNFTNIIDSYGDAEISRLLVAVEKDEFISKSVSEQRYLRENIFSAELIQEQLERNILEVIQELI